jgi:hypothetical protein
MDVDYSPLYFDSSVVHLDMFLGSLVFVELHFELFENGIPCGFTILWEPGSPYCTAIGPSGSFVSGLFRRVSRVRVGSMKREPINLQLIIFGVC